MAGGELARIVTVLLLTLRICVSRLCVVVLRWSHDNAPAPLIPVIVRTPAYIDAANGRLHPIAERVVLIEYVPSVRAPRPSILARILARFTR